MAVFAYDIPLQPYADHQHDRRHQHQSFMGALAHRQPDPQLSPNHPDVDLSDAIGYYLVEVEVPGIKDTKDITCQWTSWRSLVISGTTTRSWQSQATKTNSSAAKSGSPLAKVMSTDSDGSKSEQAVDESDDELPPYLYIAERRIGSFRRQFNFPVDVDMERLTAVLDAGLLCIKLPKKHHDAPKGSGKIKILTVD
ncbi:hypothetical protein LTR08_001548 [Meristemomyces frigidus]|nr:hypothetical protein LTR08_001548 [Meristemomyces frigidus]